jgi:hypothetical protein
LENVRAIIRGTNVAEPTRAEAERVPRLAKEIGQHVRWTRQPGGKSPRWRLEATVVATNSPVGLRLVGNYGVRHWGFALLMNNNSHPPL